MIRAVSHMNIYVLNQDKALEFYTQKLGFEVRTDFSMENGFRWLTVGPKGQPELEIILASPKAGGMFDEESAAHLTAILEKGLMGSGIFNTTDCRGTYEELKARGVEFISPPKETFYGVEALFKDGCGNWFSMTERK